MSPCYGECDAGPTSAPDVFGAKVRLAGEAVFDQHHWYPWVSAGMQYCSTKRIVTSASFPRCPARATTTLRATRANQLGIVGFGGNRRASHGHISDRWDLSLSLRACSQIPEKFCKGHSARVRM